MSEVLFASDVMTTPVMVVSHDLPVERLIALIKSSDFSGVPVMDDASRVVGFVSQSDVLQALAFLLGSAELPSDFQEHKKRASTQLLELASEEGVGLALDAFLQRPVSDFMSTDLVSCHPDDPLEAVCDRMVAHKTHRVVVLEGEDVIAGIVTATDLVQFLGITLRKRVILETIAEEDEPPRRVPSGEEPSEDEEPSDEEEPSEDEAPTPEEEDEG